MERLNLFERHEKLFMLLGTIPANSGSFDIKSMLKHVIFFSLFGLYICLVSLNYFEYKNMRVYTNNYQLVVSLIKYILNMAIVICPIYISLRLRKQWYLFVSKLKKHWQYRQKQTKTVTNSWLKKCVIISALVIFTNPVVHILYLWDI